MAKVATVVLAAMALVGVVDAHPCGNGQRVKCLATKSFHNASSTYGVSYSELGYPMCSPDGKKLFCLWDYYQSRCAVGYQPCCDIGLNLSHGDNLPANASLASEFDCAAETAALTHRVVLDSGDDTVVSEVQNMVRDSSECAASAHKRHFHHDGARNKGSAFFTFKFDPAADGCYAIEEHHPTGLSSTASCSRHFPKNARLDVDYCKGKSATLFIDQTANAAR
jgi:hypothetical protein